MKNINVNFLELKGTSYDIGKQLGNIVSVSYTHLFGNSSMEEIGADRVEALVSASPSDEDGETREDIVKTEIEDRENDNMTIPQVVNRLGMVFFLLIFNLGITIFVFLLTAMTVSYTHLDVYKRQG